MDGWRGVQANFSTPVLQAGAALEHQRANVLEETADYVIKNPNPSGTSRGGGNHAIGKTQRLQQQQQHRPNEVTIAARASY